MRMLYQWETKKRKGDALSGRIPEEIGDETAIWPSSWARRGYREHAKSIEGTLLGWRTSFNTNPKV